MLELCITITKRNLDNNLRPIDDAEGVKTVFVINTDFELAEWEIKDTLNKAVENALNRFVMENFNYVVPRIPEQS